MNDKFDLFKDRIDRANPLSMKQELKLITRIIHQQATDFQECDYQELQGLLKRAQYITNMYSQKLN